MKTSKCERCGVVHIGKPFSIDRVIYNAAKKLKAQIDKDIVCFYDKASTNLKNRR